MLNNILFMLLGAGLVSVGFFGAALTERIRRPSVPHESGAREQSGRAQRVPLIQVTELPQPTTAARPPRAPRTETRGATSTGGGEEVILALVSAGYKKLIATEATWACGVAERATVEGWTAAALRRCARGGSS